MTHFLCCVKLEEEEYIFSYLNYDIEIWGRAAEIYALRVFTILKKDVRCVFN